VATSVDDYRGGVRREIEVRKVLDGSDGGAVHDLQKADIRRLHEVQHSLTGPGKLATRVLTGACKRRSLRVISVIIARVPSDPTSKLVRS
jgi:hypothetical protein